MRYTLKNLTSFIKNERLIFIIMVICILCSSMILNFSYGLYQNYNAAKTEAEYDMNIIVPTIAEGCTISITNGDLRAFSEHISQESLDGMAVLDEYPYDIAGKMYMRFTIKDGRYNICETTRDNYTPLSEYFRIVWSPHIYIGAFAILLMYIAFLLIMPLLIIGRSTPKQILTG